VIASVHRRRHWSAEKTAVIVQETVHPPSLSVSLVKRRAICRRFVPARLPLIWHLAALDAAV